MEDIFYDVELINDFELAERVYVAGLSNTLCDYLIAKKLIWGDLA